MWLLLRMMAQNWPGLDSVLGAQALAQVTLALALALALALVQIWALKDRIMGLLK
jgi:flagellar biogenesis protein FliO